MAGYFEAAEYGQVEKLAMFVDENRDLMVADGDGLTLLHHAAQNGHLEACRCGAAAPRPPAASRRATHALAAPRCRLPPYSRLLVESTRVDIEWSDREGRTPLHWACHEGHVEVGRYLESVGASTDTQDQYGRMPLSYLPQSARMTGARDGPSNVPMLDGSAENVMRDTLKPGHTVCSQGAVAQAASFHIDGRAA